MNMCVSVYVEISPIDLVAESKSERKIIFCILFAMRKMQMAFKSDVNFMNMKNKSINVAKV